MIIHIAEHRILALRDPTGAGQARRIAMRLGEQHGLNSDDCGRLAILTTETATNLVKHAQQGEMLIRVLHHGPARGIEILAIDHGPGIRDMAAALRDGCSTAGSPGTGLGSIARLASSFDIYSTAKGTLSSAIVWSRTQSAPPSLPFDVGAVARPMEADTPCGDSWGVVTSDERAVALLADGLGHGPEAADASLTAVKVLHERFATPAQSIMTDVHAALRSTRGAAAAVAVIDLARQQVGFAGVGNINAVIARGNEIRHLVSHHGTLGHTARRIQEFTYPWQRGDTLILHSDGLTTRWDLHAYPGLLTHQPTLTAGALYRDFRRERDDASVVVLRQVGR